MLKKVLLGVAIALGVVFTIIVTRPATFEVKRTIAINAPASAVFPWVAEYEKFGQWSPWDKLDPQMKKTYEGQPGSVGARYSWSGNEDVGTGSMTITSLVPDQKVTQALEFIEPWESSATTDFELTARGDQTEVSWSMSGNNDFMGKAMSLFMNMDDMIGKDYETGLASLKAVVEKSYAEAKATETAARGR